MIQELTAEAHWATASVVSISGGSFSVVFSRQRFHSDDKAPLPVQGRSRTISNFAERLCQAAKRSRTLHLAKQFSSFRSPLSDLRCPGHWGYYTQLTLIVVPRFGQFLKTAICVLPEDTILLSSLPSQFEQSRLALSWHRPQLIM